MVGTNVDVAVDVGSIVGIVHLYTVLGFSRVVDAREFVGLGPSLVSDQGVVADGVVVMEMFAVRSQGGVAVEVVGRMLLEVQVFVDS